MAKTEKSKRGGANKSEQIVIKKMFDGGATAKQISAILNIRLKTVESFVDYDPIKAAKKRETVAREQQTALDEKKLAAEAGAKAVLEDGREKGFFKSKKK